VSAIETVRAFLLASATLLPGLSRAQVSTVTDSEMERARRSQPTVSEADIRRAQESNRMPSDAELRQTAPVAGPRIDALPKPLTDAPLDLRALAQGFDATVGRAAFKTALGPRMLVFVSFSMPREALSRLVDQAAQSGATLVLRGLVDSSLTATVARVHQLIGERRVAVEIDPQAFERYGVTHVPTFVLVRDGAQASACVSGVCVPGDGFAKVAGDVSLDYALSFFRHSAPALTRDADQITDRLQRRAR